MRSFLTENVSVINVDFRTLTPTTNIVWKDDKEIVKQSKPKVKASKNGAKK